MTPCKRPWPVLFACCVVGFNALGMVYGLGAIFTDIMDTFGVSRATASLVQSVCTGFVYGGGIFSGHLLQSWGPRKAVIVGSVLATVGFVIAFLGNHIAQVIVGVGVIAGCGGSFNFLTSLTLPGIMFNDIKSLAMGITATCSAAGSAVYPLLLRHVTNKYSVRGTFLIMAAMNCQVIVCGALIGLYTPSTKTVSVEKTAEPGTGAETDVENGDDKAADEGEERKRLMSDGKTEEHELHRADDIAVGAGDEIIMEHGYISRLSPPSLRKAHAPNIPDDVHLEETGRQIKAKSQDRESNPDEIHFEDEKGDADKSKPSPLLQSEGKGIKPVSPNSDDDAGKATPRSCCSLHAVRRALSMPLGLFRDVRYFTLSVVGGSAMLFFPLPWMFMTDMIKSNNMSVEDGSIFITILFVGNLTGRSSSGFLYKLLKSRIQIIPSVAIGMAGLTCLLLTFCEDYVHFVVISLLHGLAFGLAASTFVMSVLEIVGPGRFAVGTGYLIFCVGVFLLLAGPYGGLIRDLTNSYQLLYYIAVVHSLVSGALNLFTTLRCQQRS